MASVALDPAVRVAQHETGIAIVIEMHRLPALLRVAIQAFAAKATLVDVVFSMTAITSRRQFGLIQLRLVTCATLDAAMGIAQREVRVALVIKSHVLPFRLDMTAFTFLAETPFVDIVRAVATDTGARGPIVESRALVALVAANPDMAGPQRKPGTRVVKSPALPSVGVMAVFTVYAEFASMHVILAVTGNAGLQRVTMLAPADMAVAAFHVAMQSQQHEVSQRVIEAQRIKPDDVGLAALVVGVTVIAGTPAIEPSVIAAAGGDISLDVLVTSKAQLCLSGLVERHVAFAATSLDIGMTLDNLSRHHQRLQAARGGGIRKRYEQQAGDAAPQYANQDQLQNCCCRPARTISR